MFIQSNVYKAIYRHIFSKIFYWPIMCWNLHPPSWIRLPTHYFLFVALICVFYVLKIQSSMIIQFFMAYIFIIRLFFLFSPHFTCLFAKKSILFAIPNISTVVDSIFMTWMPYPRRGIWFPTLLCINFEWIVKNSSLLFTNWYLSKRA